MNRWSSDQFLEQLAAGAARRPLRELDPATLHRVANVAALAAQGRARQRRSRAGFAIAVAAIATLSLAAGLISSEVMDASTSPAPATASVELTAATLSLSTGDQLTVAPSSRFEVLAQTPDDRGIWLESGSLLFDVAREQPRRFEVRTPHLRAVVRGTVFSVSVDDGRSYVHVFEGSVDVSVGDQHVNLGAGDNVDSTLSPMPESWKPPFLERGLELSHRRMLEGERGRAEAPTDEAVAPQPSAVEPNPPTEPAARAADRYEDVRARLVSGDYRGVLEAVRRVRARGELNGEWLLLEGDALRGIGRRSDAATVYERAMPFLSPSQATQAGYLAARVWMEAGEFERALRVLAASRATTSGSPVEERAVVLQVRILLALNRTEDARREANRYLARFPAGGARAEMRQWADD